MTQLSTEQQRREIEQAATRAVEILESFRMVNRRLCDELIECLGRLDPYGLFGNPLSRRSGPAPATGGDVASKPDIGEQAAPAAMETPAPRQTEVERMLADLKGAKHDETGRRLNPGKRAFQYRMPQVRGSHWSD
jgi:hypothetical protein